MDPIQIIDKEKCCGCGACASACPKHCISMEFDSEGCEYPVVDISGCVGCGRCAKVCPVVNQSLEVEVHQRAFLMQAIDSEVLAQSTSGGAFTLFARQILRSGGVVYGAGWDRDDKGSYCMPLRVVHFGVEDEGELWRFRNSKYVQSEMCGVYGEIAKQLRVGREVLFSGTPCQCEGLFAYLGGKPHNLYAVDFVCRAVPARKVFARWLEWIEAKSGFSPKDARFRDKRLYGYGYSNMTAFDVEDEACNIDARPRYAQGVETDPYLRAFFSNMSDRPSCYVCPFKRRYRRTDLTLWDCFDVHRLSRELDNNLGVTRVLCHSERGVSLVEGVGEDAKVVELDPDRAVEDAREMVCCVEPNPRRGEFFSDVASMSGVELFEKWYPDDTRAKAERIVRHAAERLGVYDAVKRMAKSVLKGYKHR